MFRTIGDPVSLWESRLPAEVLRLPAELARVDAYWMTRRSSRRTFTRYSAGRPRRSSVTCG